MREISHPNCSFKYSVYPEQRKQRACMNPNNLHQMSSFNKHWGKPGQNIFSLNLQCPPGTRMQQWYPNFTLLRIQYNAFTGSSNNFLLSRRPESRQILKAYMTNKIQDRSFHSFSDSRHGRIGQNKKADYGWANVNSCWNYISCTILRLPRVFRTKKIG